MNSGLAATFTQIAPLFFFLPEKRRLKLIVTAVDEEQKTDNTPTLSRFGSGVATYGTEISCEGQIAYFFHLRFWIQRR